LELRERRDNKQMGLWPLGVRHPLPILFLPTYAVMIIDNS
jgi:hypothetical protein